MRYGLGLNVGETPKQIISKGKEAERLGLDILWVGDLPRENYAAIMASILAENTTSIHIGLGVISPFLYRPAHLASMITTLVECYGPRFELCLGVGDRDQLARVGVNTSRQSVESLLSAYQQIQEKFDHQVPVRIWLGAQGPRMIKASSKFDGVLLNFSSSRMVRWASSIIKAEPSNETFRIGIFAVSYLYNMMKNEINIKALQAASKVLLGASDVLLKKFEYPLVIKELRNQSNRRSYNYIAKRIPKAILNDFSIRMNCNNFKRYVSTLEKLGVEDLILGYPQNFSLETIRVYGNILSQVRKGK